MEKRVYVREIVCLATLLSPDFMLLYSSVRKQRNKVSVGRCFLPPGSRLRPICVLQHLKPEAALLMPSSALTASDHSVSLRDYVSLRLEITMLSSRLVKE